MTYYLAIYFCAYMSGLNPDCTDADPYFMRNPDTGRKEVYSTLGHCEPAKVFVEAYLKRAMRQLHQYHTMIHADCQEVLAND